MESYRPSGRSRPAFVPAALVAGLVCAVAGAFVYQMLVDWIPLIYVNALVTAAFGGLIGAAVGGLAIQQHSRNLRLVLGLAVACGVVGWIVSFPFAHRNWKKEAVEEIQALDAPEGFEAEDGTPITKEALVAQAEALTFSDFKEARVEGGWSVGKRGGGLDLSGIWVYLIWLTEAGIVAGMAFYTARLFADKVYCEHCGVWTEETHAGALHGLDLREAKAAAAAGDLNSLFAVPAARRGGASVTFDVEACRDEECPLWLTAKVVWAKAGKKGKDEEESLEAMRRAKISGTLYGKLETAIAQRQGA